MTVVLARQFDYPFTEADFDGIAALAHTEFGLHLERHKRDLVYGRLARRIRHLGLDSFKKYLEVLHGPLGGTERRELLCALTTNVTQFFREVHHFEQLREAVLPDLVARARAGGRVRLWSAGCSEGQEAFSLALTILEAAPDAQRLDIRVLATDVDPVVLRRGIQARYPNAELASIPDTLRRSGVVPGGDGTFTIATETRSLVTFGELNLMAAWPMHGPFDVILCRNVAIYFDRPTQERLWRRFAEILNDGGLLIIGHSERIADPAALSLLPDGVTSYTKRAKPVRTMQDGETNS